MTKPTFRGWLGQQTKRNDQVGRIAREFQRDPCVGRLRLPDSLRAHMESHGADRAFTAAFDKAVDEWVKTA